MSHLHDADVAILADAGITINNVLIPHALTPHGPCTILDAERHGEPVRLRVQWYEQAQQAKDAAGTWEKLAQDLSRNHEHVEPLHAAIALTTAVVLVTEPTRPLTRELARRPADPAGSVSVLSQLVTAIMTLRTLGHEPDHLATGDLLLDVDDNVLISHTTTLRTPGVTEGGRRRTMGIVEQLRAVLTDLARAGLIDNGVALHASQQLTTVIEHAGPHAMGDAALTLHDTAEEPASASETPRPAESPETARKSQALPRPTTSPGERTSQGTHSKRKVPVIAGIVGTAIVLMGVTWGAMTWGSGADPRRTPANTADDGVVAVEEKPQLTAEEETAVSEVQDLITLRYTTIIDQTQDTTAEIDTSSFAVEGSDIATQTADLVASLRQQKVSVSQADVTFADALVEDLSPDTATVIVDYKLHQTLAGVGEDSTEATYQEQARVVVHREDADWLLASVTAPTADESES